VRVTLRAGADGTGSEIEIDGGRADADARARVRVLAVRGRNSHWLGRVGVGHRAASGVGWAREEEELGSSKEVGDGRWQIGDRGLRGSRTRRVQGSGVHEKQTSSPRSRGEDGRRVKARALAQIAGL
jgi:hypothetical protein